MELKTYRGHIRNFAALCDELGIDKTLSREEREKAILLKGFERWGAELPDHIYGMFAFAIEQDGKITAFRDQFGTKPFYYYITASGELLYGTMIRDIMAKDGFVKELDMTQLQIYLSLTYPAGEDTFFKGVKKLMPGHMLEFENGELKITRYWHPTYAPDESKAVWEWADEIHSTLLEIMKEVKTDDESADCFLSGGVDSSYVLAVSDAKRADSCGYDEERFDESRIAAKTAEILGVEHCVAKMVPDVFFEGVPYVMYNMELPLGDASAIVFTMGCIEAAKHTKLCYSGEGSDEFFGGYNIYRNAERYGDDLPNFYVGNTNIMKEEEKQRLLRHYDPSVRPIDLVKKIYEENEGSDPLTRMADVDIQLWLEGDIYLNVDKMSAVAGLEIRMPLTDRRIFDIASRIPSRYKVTADQNKVAFRMAAAKVLPEEIAYRKKLGFIVPIRIWLADERYNSDVRRLLTSPIAGQFFNMDEIAAIYKEYVGGNSDLWRKIWTIYTFLVWYEEYFVKR
ncbi:MAG: asparagine synthetase B [Oscillospiraceae bacterium]|nr:asparagine synthetase B [Oscillospiraceae bacterium]